MNVIKLSKNGKNKGKFVALVDDDDFEYLNQFNWTVDQRSYGNYAYRRIDKGTISIMHREIMQVTNDFIIDHKDHNGLNNQKLNLRICTNSDNTKNRSKSIGKSSKYKGVSLYKKTNKWICQIRNNQKLIFLGYYETEIAAAKVYDNAAKIYHGEFANPNFKK